MKKTALFLFFLLPSFLLCQEDRIKVREMGMVYYEPLPARVYPAKKGDFNNDGFINKQDENILENKIGKIYAPELDLNQDGKVDARDLNELRPYLCWGDYDENLVACLKINNSLGTEECFLYSDGSVFRNFQGRKWNFIKDTLTYNLLLDCLEKNSLLDQTYSVTQGGQAVYTIYYRQADRSVELKFSAGGAPQELLQCLSALKEHLSLEWRERTWPFKPVTKNPWMMHLSSSYQDYGNDPYFHHGIDMLVGEHSSMYLPFRGRVTNIRNYVPGNYLYWEVEVTEFNGLRWQFHHVDRNSIPAAIYAAFYNGNVVDKGTYIGYTVSWPAKDKYGYYDHHLHLNCIDGEGNYLNPLNFFIPLADNIPPEIMDICFCQNELTRGNNDAIRAGQSDIIVRIRDFIDGSPYELPVYELGIEIASENPAEVIIPYTTLYEFIDLPGGQSITMHIHTVYKSYLQLERASIKTCGDYDCREFYYILTNSLSGHLDGPQSYWNSGLVPEGNYVLTIHARDNVGNKSQRSFPVLVTRKKGIIKR